MVINSLIGTRVLPKTEEFLLGSITFNALVFFKLVEIKYYFMKIRGRIAAK